MKRVFGFVFSLLMLLSFSACASGGKIPDPPEEIVEVTDPNYPIEIGGITIEEQPEKVISLSPALTETIFALGISDTLVGRSLYCDYPVEANSLPAVGSAQLLDLQQLTSLNPRYVLTQTILSSADMEYLEQQGIDVIYLPKAGSLEAVKELYSQLFLFFWGKRDGAEASVEYLRKFDEDISRIQGALPQGDHPTVLYVVGLPNVAATPDSFEGSLLNLLGLENLARNGQEWQFDFDNLEEEEPDLIIAANGVRIEALEEDEVLGDLEAVEEGRIYVINSLAFERQSPRMLTELKALAASVYSSLPPEEDSVIWPDDEDLFSAGEED